MEKDVIIYKVNKSNNLKICILMFLIGIMGVIFFLFSNDFVSSAYRMR